MVVVQKAVLGSDLRAKGGLFEERRQGWERMEPVIRPGVSNLCSVTFRDHGRKLSWCQALNTQGQTANDTVLFQVKNGS